jgi:hypothetical protein
MWLYEFTFDEAARSFTIVPNPVPEVLRVSSGMTTNDAWKACFYLQTAQHGIHLIEFESPHAGMEKMLVAVKVAGELLSGNLRIASDDFDVWDYNFQLPEDIP